MRWVFGPPHLTLKPPHKKWKEKNQEIKKYRKWAFQLSVKISSFGGGGVPNSLFLQLGQKRAHPINTIKIRVSAINFQQTDNRHGQEKPEPENPVFISFCFFLLFQQQKRPKLLKPYFSGVWANIKKNNSFKSGLEQGKHVLRPPPPKKKTKF